MPLETIHAFRDHGHPALTLTENVAEAQRVLVQLAELEIDIDEITQQLEDDGVRKFDEAFGRLMETLAQQH
jgi:transaldolase/transaldolase/glucose-6-phosphate isomerase